MKTLYYSFISLLLFLPFIATATDDTQIRQFTNAKTLFLDAVEGDKSSLPKATALFEQLLDQQPDNVVFAAYLGGATTLAGGHAFWPWKKMKLAETGMDMLDANLAKLTKADEDRDILGVPMTLEVWLVSAYTFTTVPDMFHRYSDGTALIRKLLAHPDYATSPAQFRAAVQMRVALIAEQEKDDQAFQAALKQVLNLDPHGRYGSKARLMQKGSK